MDGMRLVFVNHCHPETPHVCALRARGFAEAMARRGHRVVLLSETLSPDDDAPTAAEVGQALRDHDWSAPYRLACAPRPAPLLRRARLGDLPWPCNKAVLAAAYAIRGGPFADWVDGARPYWDVLKTAFGPQAAWGIFGNTGAWIIAREVARRAGAPWVMDLKDGWDHFVPAGMRRATAWRFAGAAAATALSQAHAAELRSYFAVAAEVVYSGIPPEALEPSSRPPAAATSGAALSGDIVLSGSLYDSESVDILVAGLGLWLAGGADGARPRLRYFGADGDRLRHAVARLGPSCDIDIQGYRPLPELLEALGHSRVNLYVRSPRTLFHHKLIELLSRGRPIVSIQEESAEARRIAAAASAEELARELDQAWRAPAFVPPDRAGLARYTWDAQAATLEATLERVVA